MSMDTASYIKDVVADPWGEVNTAQFLLSTTLALGVNFVYLAPAADSTALVFKSSHLYTVSPLSTLHSITSPCLPHTQACPLGRPSYMAIDHRVRRRHVCDR